MGLYQKICERLVNSQNTQIDTIGLLAKAENFLQKTSPSKVEVVEESNMNDCSFDSSVTNNYEESKAVSIPYFDCKIDEPFIYFKNFATEVGLEKIAILIPVGNYYQTIFSYGVETDTRDESISTVDFWNGTLEANQWYSLSGEDLSSFYQLFSENDIQNLKYLHIKKINVSENDSIIVLILEDTENSIIDLESIEIVIPNLVNNFKIFIELANSKILFPEQKSKEELYSKIKSGLSLGQGFMYSISIKDILKKLNNLVSFDDFTHIFNLIGYIISKTISENDIVFFTNELEIHYVYFAQTEVDLSTIVSNLNSAIIDYFSVIENPNLDISKYGCSTNGFEILNFLLLEN